MSSTIGTPENGTSKLWKEISEHDRISQELTLRLQGAKFKVDQTNVEVARVEKENAAVEAQLQEVEAIKISVWEEAQRLEALSRSKNQEISLLTSQSALLGSEIRRMKRLVNETRANLKNELDTQMKRLEAYTHSQEV